MSPARSTLCIAVAFVTAGCAREMPSTPSAGTPPSFTTGMPINAGSREAYTLAVFGDFPYGDAKIAEMPDFFAMINADPKVDIVVHLGDIKAGSNSPCTNAYFAMIDSAFATFKEPLVYTPGDNEWVDCHQGGKNNGLYTPTDTAARGARRPARRPACTGRCRRAPSRPRSAARRRRHSRAARPRHSPGARTAARAATPGRATGCRRARSYRSRSAGDAKWPIELESRDTCTLKALWRRTLTDRSHLHRHRTSVARRTWHIAASCCGSPPSSTTRRPRDRAAGGRCGYRDAASGAPVAATPRCSNHRNGSAWTVEDRPRGWRRRRRAASRASRSSAASRSRRRPSSRASRGPRRSSG